MEDVADPLAGSLEDLSGSFGRAYADVLGPNADTLTDIRRTRDGVQGDQVSGAFAQTFSNLSGSFAGAFTKVAGSVGDVAPGSGVGFGHGGGGG